VILTLTLNWSVFQTLVFDMTSKGPIEIARIVAAPARGSGSDLAADPLAGLQTAYDQLGVDAAAFGKLAGPNPQVLRGGEASAADDLWRARSALFMSTAGIMAIAAVAVGVLAAIGPVFIALFLFQETRGLFAGWLRALLAASLTSMVCWITTAVLLVVIDPWLLELARTRDAGAPDLQTASVLSSVVFVFAAAQAALTMGAGLIASGFQLNFSRPPRPGAPSPALRAAPAERLSRAERLVLQLQHSASSQRLSFASAVAGPTLGAGLRGGQAVAGFDGRSGGVRLGDGYRRDAHFDRFRKRDRST
jgi:type IV secretion system protein VirB6